MDLNQMFGGGYLITLDESWGAETPENQAGFRAEDIPWNITRSGASAAGSTRTVRHRLRWSYLPAPLAV